MKSILISSATIVAVALSLGHATAQESGKAGAAAGGGGAGMAGAAEGGAGSQRMLPQGGAAPGAAPAPGAGEASPGMKPAGAAPPAPGQRKQGENVGVSPKVPPTAPNEPAGGHKDGQMQPANKAGAEAQPGKPGGQESTAGKANGQARPAPKITHVQETKVQQTFKTVNVAPVHVDFNIGIGVAVPRTVVLDPLPPAVITIVPEYEGYRFFVVPGQIVIVDPITLAIVAVLPL